MDKARLALLRAELTAQTRQIEAIYNKIEERRRSEGQAELESLGYQLHNLYCAFEDLFEVVAGTFENQIEEEGRYHIELLRRLTVRSKGFDRPCFRRSATVFSTTYGPSVVSFGTRIPLSLTRGRSGSSSTMH